ncbi:succinyl-diaminopimelate desuccinylase [Gilvimarinus sp. F26214L]|uniref:succinyl-diaminopimelate desuccinylase n=1 Tax=Gilvimarinus sp. DZF01 TaxID=3461371 RepID=UPI004045F457
MTESATLALACELIRRPSVTPEDAGCLDLIAERLSALGFRCQMLPFGDVSNLWAVRGDGGPLLAFAGHTDVVPTGPLDQWRSPPFEPTIEDGHLRGRGAADMKGSLAAMVTACERFISEHGDHSGRIAFLLTSDEEGPAQNGTRKVVEWLKEEGTRIDWCIIGEPTSGERFGDTIKNGRRGSLHCDLTVKGQQGHIAYPHMADNPIHRVAAPMAALSTEHWDHGNEYFPATSFQISNINGGTGATNVIPGTVHLRTNFRFSTEVTEEVLRERTEAILNKFDIDYELRWELSGQPFITERGTLTDAVSSAIEAETGLMPELSTSGGTSDGRFIAPSGAQVIEFGPCNATIHKLNECVAVEDLETLSRIYERCLQNLLLTP